MIDIKDLSKRYGKLSVLDTVNVDIKEKGIFAVLGPNGSGKTTLIKCILGMVIPEKGSIYINDQEILGQWAYRDRLAYMPQIANFPPNLRVEELIRMITSFRGKNKSIEDLIAQFDLSNSLAKKIGHLSGGTKQKVNILLTFMIDAPLIILDEPTSGLDPVALLKLKKLILEEKKRGKIILITSHSISFVNDLADEIVFLLEGKIYFRGSIPQLKQRNNQPDLEQAIVDLLTESNV